MEITRTRIKICGITNIEDAKTAASVGADALGFVFYSDSPRCVSVDTVQQIIQSLPAFVNKVGLFVDAEIEAVNAVINQAALDYIQFHGEEDESYCASFSRPYIKAIRVKPELDLIAQINRYKSASAILLDAWHPKIAGGTGESFDWDLLNRLPEETNQAIILAGGLNQDNVFAAVQKVKPYAVDVSSGVEEKPGKKSAEKMRNFIDQVKRGNQ